ncbi:uncharacterized protein LOC133194658 [Saccostrea echinata]|uniref:uncharacterized protein LOC133194658 n=1 Tax=Saccostrea echinata TaxID=191078 RepID=UPI002A8132FE|nr:uncharacterized protein LOC133194658 [Saccostrea echinata]
MDSKQKEMDKDESPSSSATKKEETRTPSFRSSIPRCADDAPAFSRTSFGISNENELPRNTCFWTINVIDKFGIRRVLSNPFKLIYQEWWPLRLTKVELARIEEIADICYLPWINFNSLEDIPFQVNMPFEKFGNEWFPAVECAELKLFSKNLQTFRFHLFDVIQQLHTQKKRESMEPCGIEYHILFEKFLGLFEFRAKSQPQFPRGLAKIFDQEISSKADLLCLKSDEPKTILFLCKHGEVKRKCSSDEAGYSPARKKLCSTTGHVTVTKEATSSTNVDIGMPSDLYAQHVGELLAHMDSSVMNRGLLGMVIQKTNVIFTYLEIEQQSYEKMRKRKEPGSDFDQTLQKNPVLYYTDQYNFLKRDDRHEIFKALVAVKMMEMKISNK